MSASGLLSVRVYTSIAQLPISGATVTVTEKTPEGDRLIAQRITDDSGRIPLLTIATPERSDSLSPGAAVPYTRVDILAEEPDYERVLVEDAQIFADVLTQQNLELIPIEEQPQVWNMTEVFPVTAQPL